MTSARPTDNELLTAVRSLWTASTPPPGIKKIVASLRAKYPDWEPHINERTVRDAIRQCEGVCEEISERKALSDKKAEDGDGGVVGESKGRPKGEDKEDVDLHEFLEFWNAWMAAARRPREVPAKWDANLFSKVQVAMGSHCVLASIMLPAAVPPTRDADRTQRIAQLAPHIFYFEWDCFRGPDPAEPMAAARRLDAACKLQTFPALFPRRMGQYLGPEAEDGMTFEEYVLGRLQLPGDHGERFRSNKQWLLWALTRTADRELGKAINCCLVVYFQEKARHLEGSGAWG
ncbi:hypothetical protein C8J57DRAFT_1463721 [Mycena rebaudengoi]|nr:hypothetical protein C8J57DRAFT_1463721 [Mycena rebaudengoi]